MSADLWVDFGNMLSGVLPRGGVSPDRLQKGGDLACRFRRAAQEVAVWRAAGKTGFCDLPEDEKLAARTRELADRCGDWCDTVVVVGIGGSALGARALRDALLAPSWNELGASHRGGFPRLRILENPDPESVSSLLDRLDLERALVNVVSKSGTTAETVANFLVLWKRLEDAFGTRGAAQRVVFTTGAGPMSALAAELKIRRLPVPGNVGGRFSVLSPAGLFPAALAGIDTRALLEGAGQTARRCASEELARNPAGMLATLLHAADTEAGARIHVLMPYADRLRAVAAWFQQLWAESLGKALSRSGERVEIGPTPLPALGAVDQHAQLQLFIEGPRDKAVVFLGLADAPEQDLAIPRLFPGEPDLNYLGGRTLFELLDAERRATAEALRRESRMNMTIMLPRVTARTAGSLLMFFQIATLYAGALYGVDPLNQPGVELAKTLTSGLTGRPGYRSPETLDPDPRGTRWQV